jgi:hypothetical protein
MEDGERKGMARDLAFFTPMEVISLRTRGRTEMLHRCAEKAKQAKLTHRQMQGLIRDVFPPGNRRGALEELKKTIAARHHIPWSRFVRRAKAHKLNPEDDWRLNKKWRDGQRTNDEPTAELINAGKMRLYLPFDEYRATIAEHILKVQARRLARVRLVDGAKILFMDALYGGEYGKIIVRNSSAAMTLRPRLYGKGAKWRHLKPDVQRVLESMSEMMVATLEVVAAVEEEPNKET